MAAACAPTQIADRAGADIREREALTELADFARPMACASRFENIFTTEPGQYRQTPAEVAETVKAVNHPNVVALIDFSHAYIESTYQGPRFPRSRSPPWRRSPGICMSTTSSAVRRASTSRSTRRKTPRMGIGDLHMPLGWGDIDWDSIFAELSFLPDTVLMMEIGRRYRREQPASLARARELVSLSAPKAIAAE